MPARPAVRRLRAALTLTPLLLTAAAMPTVALAAPSPPGSNGDVKIHASTTPVNDERDQTPVCSFYLDAFDFDTVQDVSWHIDQQPPTGTAEVLSGTLVLVNGTGHTNDMSLPAGHYKLTWTFTGETGKAKSKVFMSDCPAPTQSPTTPVASPSGTGTPGGPGGPGNPGAPGSGLAHTGVDLPTTLAAGGLLAALGLCLRSRTPRRRRRGAHTG